MFALPTALLLLALGQAPSTDKAPAAPVPQAAAGPGDLLVAPTRLVFDMRKRTGEIHLSNIGAVAATYRVSLVGMEMDLDGGMKETALPKGEGQIDVAGLVRFSPREVTLGPQESQVVRVQVRKPAELPAGEYRLHMMFRGIPPAPEPPADGKAEAAKGISIKLVPVYGLAVPVIVRHGETSAKAAIADLALDGGARILRFRLRRDGNQSLYGNVAATYLPRQGASQVLAEANGLAVYTPNADRRIVLNLAQPKAGALGPGRLRVTFSLPPTEGGALLAEGFLDLP